MIKRELYLSKIRGFYSSDLIKVLIGIRRCGKSVLLWQIVEELKEKGVDPSHIMYLNFEDLEYAYLLEAIELHKYIKSKIEDESRYYLFFDEIQNVEAFEKVINSFRSTMNVSIFITGSNSKLLSGELASLLSGRYVSFKIMPFTFREVCELRSIPHHHITDENVMEYMLWGGMPQRLQFDNVDETRIFLTDLYNSIVLKDIV